MADDLNTKLRKYNEYEKRRKGLGALPSVDDSAPSPSFAGSSPEIDIPSGPYERVVPVPSSPTTNPKPLAAAIQNTTESIENAATGTQADKPMPRDEGREYIRQLGELQKKHFGAELGPNPEKTKADLATAIKGAQKLYTDRATRNEWLEVAQTLAGAIAQFGAAQEGMRTGQNMAIEQPKGIDWGSRTDRAMREYEMQRSGAKDIAAADLGTYEDRRRNAEKAYEREKEPLTERYRQVSAEGLYSKKAEEADARATARAEAQQRAQDIRGLASELVAAEKEEKRIGKLEAAGALKDKDILKTVPELATINAEATTPHWYGDDLDEKKRDALIRERIDAARERAQEIRESLRRLRRGRSVVTPNRQQESQSPPATAPEEKEINGRIYTKVKGGWQLRE